MSGRPWYIYLLSHPITGAVRYVGITHRKQRFAEHLYSVKRIGTHCASWIKGLLAIGLKPLMTTVETGVGPNWAAAERRWIADLRSLGVNLTNHTDGGEGTLGQVFSPERRAKQAEMARRIHTGMKRSLEARQNMRLAQKELFERKKLEGVKRVMPTKSPETLLRMSEAQQGKKRSSEHRAALSKLHLDPNGPFQTEEYRQKQREKFLARPADVRAAMASNQKGKTKSEDTKRRMSEAALLRWARQKAKS